MKYWPDYTRFLARAQKTNSAPRHNEHHREPTSDHPTRPKLCPRYNLIQPPNTHDHKSNSPTNNPPTQHGTHTLAHTCKGNHPTHRIHNTNNHTTNTNNDQRTTTLLLQTPTTNTTTTPTVIILSIARMYPIYPTHYMPTHLPTNTHTSILLHLLNPQCSNLHHQPLV